MRQAYLIIAHTNRRQLEKLLRLLDYSGSDIFLLADVKAKSFDTNGLAGILSASNLKVLSRQKITWGGASQIAAELALLQAAVPGCYDRYHLLSGMDLPLKSNEHIEAYLRAHEGVEFVPFYQVQLVGDGPAPFELPGWLAAKAGTYAWADRIRYWHPLQELLGRKKGSGKIDGALVACQRLAGVDRLAGPARWLGKGGQWFSITHSLAAYVVEQAEAVMRDFGSCVCGDEVFLQTLVLNSPFRERVFPDGAEGAMPASLRRIDWERGNPYVFRASDLDELRSTPALFARKFDERVDAEIIDAVCAMLGTQAAVSA